MTTITLTPDLEEAISAQARKQATTPEQVVLEILREKFLPLLEQINETDTLSDWERQMQDAAIAVEEALAQNCAVLKGKNNDDNHIDT
ncbi:MAG: hypothetical protein ACRYFS_23465 [Janthinobacterium lividum]